MRFKLSGESVCGENQILSLSKYENHKTWIYTLIEDTWKCNQNSELEIYISTQ